MGSNHLRVFIFIEFSQGQHKKKRVTEEVGSLKSKKRWKNITLTLITLFAYPSFLPVIGFV